MDPRLLKYYNRELQFVREMGGEFAREFPKIASRLGLDGFECADPYVERLLEGFAFLAARVQLQIDEQFPRFTQHLLETVYPHYLAPTPSMAVVQFNPNRMEGALADGFSIGRGSVLRSVLGKGEQTSCEYRTAHDVTLWPLELTELDYFTYSGSVARLDIPDIPGVKAGLRLRLQTTGGLTLDKTSVESLPLFLRGGDETRMLLYEQLVANSVAMVIRPTQTPAPWREVVDDAPVRPLGFTDKEALLPVGRRSFGGYRLLQEYFAMPDRFLFAELNGLGPAIRRQKGNAVDILILFDRFNPALENSLDVNDLALFCTPAINLFPKRADRIHLGDRDHDFHLVADRTRPMDFEIHSVTEVTGFGSDIEREFRPLYGLDDLGNVDSDRAYYTVRRSPRLMSSRQRSKGPRSSYTGSEVYMSIVDAREAPYPLDLKQLAVHALCTNRDLPLAMPVGRGSTDFTMESSAPVDSVRALAGPTKPVAPYATGDTAWRLIAHLTPNFHTLMDTDERQGAAALRQLLMLYSNLMDPALRKQIDGVRSVTAESVVRRLPTPGPISYGRGMGITLVLEEVAFEGSGVFLLGEVLERFFARYVSMNSFTQTTLRTVERGEVARWPIRIGNRHTL